MPSTVRFAQDFRNSAPYINALRGRTLVVSFGGEALTDAQLPSLIHDIALLHSLGIRLVLVYGARTCIEQRLRDNGLELQYVDGLRVTDALTLRCVIEAVGALRVQIEAQFSIGLANSPMAGARLRVCSGNFVTARPLGIRNGVDFQHTGEVRRIDTDGINRQLDSGNIVLLSPLGYSPTGEVFNLRAEEVASHTAIALRSDKLITLYESKPLHDSHGNAVRELTPQSTEQLLASHQAISTELSRLLTSAIQVVRNGVHRVHLLPRHYDGALLQELFTRDGIGTLISEDPFEGTRPATIEDVAGILELISPLEQEGILVRRSRERLEMEINQFTVVERDGGTIGCAALYPFPQNQLGELACLAISSRYRHGGRGDALLEYLERQARSMGLQRLFVLTTRTAHWFIERGFQPAEINELPMERQALYNFQRRSKVFIKQL